jgi:translation elongation factor EF-G
LTGGPLTDVEIVLVHGRSHTKHTEGGDFREATCRAIRQGLMRAENILLEPFYHFDFFIQTEFLGRLFSDIQMNAGEFSLESDTGALAHVSGRGPVQTFGEYQQELLSYTKGNGSVSLVFDGYDRCHNPEEVIAAAGYDPVTDVDNPTHSVFCSHGAGFTVPWDQVPDMMHTLITL